MNEFISVKSLDYIASRRCINNSLTPKIDCSPTTSTNSRIRILSPTTKINQKSKSPTLMKVTNQFRNLMKREALQRKLNFLTPTLAQNKSETMCSDEVFSDRILIKSFENFVNDTDEKLKKIQRILSISPRAQTDFIPQEFEDNSEQFELKLQKTQQLLEQRKKELQTVRQQYLKNQLLLKKLRFELDSLAQDHKILEYCTQKSIKDEISTTSASLIKNKQLVQDICQFIINIEQQLITTDCKVGKFISNLKNVLIFQNRGNVKLKISTHLHQFIYFFDMYYPSTPNTVRGDQSSKDNSEFRKVNAFIINQWRIPKMKKIGKCSYSQENLKTEQAQHIPYFKKKHTLNLVSERSTQISSGGDVFNDKYIHENMQREEIFNNLSAIRMRNLQLKYRMRSSAEEYKEFQELYGQEFESKKTQLSENILHCFLAISGQRQQLIDQEAICQKNQQELDKLNEKLQFVTNSIQLTNLQNTRTLKDQYVISRLKLAKQKQLLLELLEYVDFLQFKYSNHIEYFQEYLQQLQENINCLRMEIENCKNY